MNTQKPELFEKQQKIIQKAKTQKCLEICQICDMPFDQRSLIHREACFPPCFAGQNQPKNYIIFGDFIHLLNINFQIWDHIFSLLFPQGFWISKSNGHPTLGSGGKKTFKVNTRTDRRTDGQTDGQTDGHFDLYKASAQRADALKTACSPLHYSSILVNGCHLSQFWSINCAVFFAHYKMCCNLFLNFYSEMICPRPET